MKPSLLKASATSAKTSQTTDVRAEVLAELIFGIAKCFFRLKAFGMEEGFITKLGGVFGFVRSLALYGPLSVPQIAKMRPVSRQRMQKLADQLAGEGLVEFVENPRHKRSKLVALTAKGQFYYSENTERLLSLVSTFQIASNKSEIRSAIGVIDALCEGLIKARGRRAATSGRAKHKLFKPQDPSR